MRLKNLNSSVEDKDEDADTENSAMLKATKNPVRAGASRREKSKKKKH